MPAESKIDKLEAYKLRVHHRLTYEQIGQHFGVTAQAVHASLQSLTALLPDPEAQQAALSIYPELLHATKLKLLSSILQRQDLSNVPVNHLALAFEKVDKAARLETGQSTDNKAMMLKIIGESDKQIYPETPSEGVHPPIEPRAYKVQYGTHAISA